MVFLSTSFRSSLVEHGERLLEALNEFEIDGIELEYRISKAQLEQMRLPLKQSGLKIVSIHNYCPIPQLTPPVNGSGDVFLLSALDGEERQRAVAWTMRTIEEANDLEAPVVILHCGHVDMLPELDRLYLFHRGGQSQSPAALEFIQRKLDELNRLRAGHIDALRYALDRLVRYAERQGVTLGLENRYHYHELPRLEDFRILFDEFRGAQLGYWHDTGHAHANEALGLIEPGSLLLAYAEGLIGMHWHDAVGLEDHLAPGSGEIDFDALHPFLKEHLPVVMELKPGTSHAQVKEGIQNTRKQLLAAAESRKSDNPA
jgi:sugar phosphate isomerase/epimerase